MRVVNRHGAARTARSAENRIGVIVIGTPGRTGLTRLLLGSVAERVIRSAPCPVLIVRHPEHEFVRPDALEKVSRKQT